MTFRELLEEARQTVREIEHAQIEAEMPDALFVDVRETDEWESGHIPGARHLPLGSLEASADPQSPSAAPALIARRDDPIVVYCGVGQRSLIAGKVLRDLGYQNVASLKGGYSAWKLRR